MLECGMDLAFDLAALVAGANPQLVDLRFGHVGPLLCVVQLVLELPELGQVGVCLLLLQRANQGKKNIAYKGPEVLTVHFHLYKPVCHL